MGDEHWWTPWYTAEEILTRQDLDAMAAEICATPGCAHRIAHGTVLFQDCHPDAGLWVSYGVGVLRLRCRTCRALVFVVAVGGVAPPDGRQTELFPRGKDGHACAP